MPRPLPSWLPALGLGLAGLGALLFPRLVDPFVQPQVWDAGIQELHRRALVGYGLAAAFALGALGLVGWRLHRRRERALPDAVALLVAGVVIASLAALPAYDEAALAWMEARYFGGDGPWHAAHGLSMGAGRAGAHGAPGLEAVSPPGEVGAGSVDLGRFPVVKGDQWLLFFTTMGPRWGGFEPPRVVADGLRCDAAVLLDHFGDRTPRHGTVFQCVAQATGVVHVRVEAHHPDLREHDHRVVAVPAMYFVHGSWLDESALALGASLALGATLLVVAYAPRLSGRDRERADALALLGLGSAALVWAILLAGRAKVVGTSSGAFFLLAFLAAAWAFALAAAGWRKALPRWRSRALPAAGACAVAGLASFPVLARASPPWMSPHLFIVAALVTALLAAMVGLGWSRADGEAAAEDGGA